MANGKISFGKQSGGQLALVIPDGVDNTEVIVPESGVLATKQYADLKVALTSFTGANVTLDWTGYQKLPSGLIIQWGVLADISWAANTFRTINYPVSFPNAVLQHTTTLSNSAGTMGNVNTHQLSSSQLQLSVNYSGAATVRWVAIGY